ncbi:MAG: transposase family protein, partial [Gammaproteobacteria bacterium]|nr:transposase family protein [Gammaproteobacteria bacterium]
NCEPCQRSSKSKGGIHKEDRSIPRPTVPGKQWAMDIAGPFHNGNYLIAIIDYASKFPEVWSSKGIISKVMVDKIRLVCDNYGNPDGVVTDNGPQFIAREFQGFHKGRDIHHYTTSFYHP